MESVCLTRDATVENLDAVTAFVEGCAERFGLAEDKKLRLLVAVEEAFVNLCRHAYPDAPGEAELACDAEGDALVVEIADEGAAFDVLSLPEPDTAADFMDRPVGGLGVHFIRKLTDAVSYRRSGGRNILRLVVRRGGEAPS